MTVAGAGAAPAWTVTDPIVVVPATVAGATVAGEVNVGVAMAVAARTVAGTATADTVASHRGLCRGAALTQPRRNTAERPGMGQPISWNVIAKE
jgi:hypothetical protein